MKRLIITGDDFGLAVPVNEAIVEAHQRGILTTTSLMVRATAAADAVEQAHRLPSLRVGLHLVLVDGSSVLPPQTIPDLVNERGEFSSHLVRSGIDFFFRREVRQQLEAEIRAQFQAFHKTGLSLDHVNTHHHMHLHPTVSGIILKVGREHGMRAMRLPYEPLIPSWRASRKGLTRRLVSWLFLSPWVRLLRKRLRRTQMRSNEFAFGMYDSGKMDTDRVHQILKHLPEGVTEIYFHPATRLCPGMDGNSHPQAELEALTNPSIQAALLASNVQGISFSDL